MNVPRAATIVNHNRRIWLRSGKVEQSTVTEPTLVPTIKWGAAVYDSATLEQVEEYPHLEGEAAAPNGDYEYDDVARQYLDQCRFADGQPDVDKLINNIQMNIWQLNVEQLDRDQINH